MPALPAWLTRPILLGAVLWRTDIRGSISASPVVFDGVVYAGTAYVGVVHAFAATGDLRWRFKTGDWVESSPTVAGDTVYVAGYDGFLYAVE